MANGVIAVVKTAWSHAFDSGLVHTRPFNKLRMKSTPPRLRIATPEEIAALMGAADRLDPEIGDAIVLALYTGQRQADVLALCEAAEEKDRIHFRQRKTDARVRVRALPALKSRLAEAKARKQALGFSHVPNVVVSRRSGKPVVGMNCTHRFADLRAEAAKIACQASRRFRSWTFATRPSLASHTPVARSRKFARSPDTRWTARTKS